MKTPHRTTESRLKDYSYVSINELSKYEPKMSMTSSSALSLESNLLVEESWYDQSTESVTINIDIQNLREKETNLRINRGSEIIDTSS